MFANLNKAFLQFQIHGPSGNQTAKSIPASKLTIPTLNILKTCSKDLITSELCQSCSTCLASVTFFFMVNVRRNKWIPIAEGVKGKGKKIAQDSIDLTVLNHFSMAQDGPNKNQEIQTDRPLRRRRSPKLKGPVPEHLKRGRKNFSSIRTESPRSNPRARQKGRLFELEHCPVFYPTPDEFKDLMKYFELIGSRLKSHGVGKAVPPLRWRLPFVLDTEHFKFKTRLQHLNSMEASSRANTNFMEQLYLFHKQQGNSAAVITNGSKLQVPVINYQPVDLWKLRKQINEMGGYDNDECLGKRKKTGWIGINYIDLDVEDYLLCVEFTNIRLLRSERPPACSVKRYWGFHEGTQAQKP
ncbi:hypothetical protein PPACK8108_LOCUS23715 [Phakopsora pachyrhizi]|uniref:Uncharacterized protein n=1 Tax=Phakopsora pachyrhizi TaxID=170000 RepID=A0AAV0BQD1_PHAPC|nr:hypothetical protein PPACK8108_LOCUS23715 [Phakopsora pachyrhizi]